MREDNLTTLIYITRGDECLFIVKGDRDDINSGKWLGIGGHLETGETPTECMLREINEESEITVDELDNFKWRGHVTFVSDKYGVEYMHVYSADYIGTREVTPGKCEEGELCWVKIDKIHNLPIWEGDHLIFDELFSKEEKFFEMKLEYVGDKLVGNSRKYHTK